MNLLLTLQTHAHESADFLTEFGELVNSPAHWAFELMFSILFDLIVLSLLNGLLIKRVIIPRLKKTIHAEIDKEHGIPEHD